MGKKEPTQSIKSVEWPTDLLTHGLELAVWVVQESKRRVILHHLPLTKHQHSVVEGNRVQPFVLTPETKKNKTKKNTPMKRLGDEKKGKSRENNHKDIKIHERDRPPTF